MRRGTQAAEAAGKQAEQAAQAARASEAARTLAEHKNNKSAPEPETPKAKQPSEEVVRANEKIPRGNQTRYKALSELRALRGEPEGNEEAPKQEAKEEEPKTEATPPKQEPEVKAEPAAAPEVPSEPVLKTVRVKVDGEEFDVPEQDVQDAGGVKPYQIIRAQENRLKKMGDHLTVMRQFQQQMAQAAQAAAPPAKTLSDSEFIQSKIDAIRFGTPEESAAAMSEVLSRNRVNPQHSTMQAVLAIKKEAAVQEFAKDFPEIVSNPILMKAAMAVEAEEIQKISQGQAALDFSAMYKRVGQTIRGALPAHQPQPTQQATSHTSSVSPDKEARKASISEPPKASAARASLPEEEKPETREQSLARMRKSRGQLAH